MNANEIAECIRIRYPNYDDMQRAATMLRQQQNLLDEYHEQALNDSRTISKLVGEMAEKEAEIEALKKQCCAFQNASIDLAKKNAFLEDWKKTWLPYIKEVHGINTSILRKAQDK